jgi:tRNA1Val (adenine37-N6)-methyltransferase
MGKRNSTFRFKQFMIDHSKASMKVGTDGVLLGAWVHIDGAKYILDIGTGSGVIALILAQRTPDDVKIIGVDIETADVEQARENVSNSPWKEKVEIFCSPIQSWKSPDKFDLIVSNPPFFINSFEPPDKKRFQSRHTATLTHPDLLSSAALLLKPTGRLAVILPTVEGIEFMKTGASLGLSCSRLYSFRPRKNKPVERWLIELTPGDSPLLKGEIIMYDEGTELTDGYKMLTRDFYFKI